MLRFAYNLSTPLEQSLTAIENLRKQILVVPLPLRNELHMKWEALIDQVYGSLVLAYGQVTHSEVKKVLESPEIKSAYEADIRRYRNALAYISYNWFVTTKTVTIKDIIYIHHLAFGGNSRVSEAELKHILNYIQVKPEHPIIQSALAQLLIVLVAPFATGNERLSRLLTDLFLYKSGYNFRNLLVLETYWLQNTAAMNEVIESAKSTHNLTRWLEFFAQAIITRLKSIKVELTIPDFRSYPAFFDVNQRQKQILTILENPAAKMTNRDVQQQFNVSQITASRDLTQLTTLGLIFSYGRGRSIYYTRA